MWNGALRKTKDDTRGAAVHRLTHIALERIIRVTYTMESEIPKLEKQKFSSPEEELKFLREEVVRKEQALAEKGGSPEREQIVKETVQTYAQTPVYEAVAPPFAIPAHEQEAIVLDLSPEPHDKQIEALVAILQEKGVRTAFDVVERMDNVHIYDDLHRFIVQYIEAGLPVKDLPERSPLWRPLHMALFEISLPETTKEEA